MLLSAEPQTFVLESTVVRLDNGVIQFGVEPRCGGTLVEVSWRGRNFVNNADCTGRQVQAALYDGNAKYDACSGCEGNWGWDPVQGGDIHNFGSPLLAKNVTADSVYIATRPNEWYPDNKGGGPGRPVPSDVMIEQTASFVPDYPYAVRLHYRITHLNSDTHTSAVQEFPAVWVNHEYDRFVSYAGIRPWTGRPVTANPLSAPGQAAPVRYVSEHWAALVNARGVGLTVYVPNQYPYAVGLQLDGTSGEFGSAANYFRPHVPFMFGPGSVLEGDVYIIAGDYRQARQDIEAMHDGKPPSGDTLPPFGALDVPIADQDVTDVVSSRRMGPRRCGDCACGDPSRRDARWHRVVRHPPARRGERLSVRARTDWVFLPSRYQTVRERLTPAARPGHRQGRKCRRAPRGDDRHSQW